LSKFITASRAAIQLVLGCVYKDSQNYCYGRVGC
jgi:hypothetical protein